MRKTRNPIRALSLSAKWEKTHIICVALILTSQYRKVVCMQHIQEVVNSSVKGMLSYALFLTVTWKDRVFVYQELWLMIKLVGKNGSHDTKNWDDTDLHFVCRQVTQIVEYKFTFSCHVLSNFFLSARNIEPCNIWHVWAINLIAMLACDYNHIILLLRHCHFDRSIWYCKQSEDKHVVECNAHTEDQI